MEQNMGMMTGMMYYTVPRAPLMNLKSRDQACQQGLKVRMESPPRAVRRRTPFGHQNVKPRMIHMGRQRWALAIEILWIVGKLRMRRLGK